MSPALNGMSAAEATQRQRQWPQWLPRQPSDPHQLCYCGFHHPGRLSLWLELQATCCHVMEQVEQMREAEALHESMRPHRCGLLQQRRPERRR